MVSMFGSLSTRCSRAAGDLDLDRPETRTPPPPPSSALRDRCLDLERLREGERACRGLMSAKTASTIVVLEFRGKHRGAVRCEETG
mmetsp:Transcript_7593/g.28493  ORF Transcript_7593/g.28493 Transcript_7593/m.28493 type:complete len:86 (-) Transcript_7593:27-284(-)